MLTGWLWWMLISEGFAMSWNDAEYSTAEGMPVMLFTFSLEQKVWRYTSADDVITVMGKSWLPVAIKGGTLAQGAGDHMEITLPMDNEVVSLFRGVPPSSPVKLMIYRLHMTDAQREYETVWVGSISEIRREQPNRAKLISVGIASSLTRQGLRLTWGRSCPYSVYDSNCRVQAGQFARKGLVIRSLTGAGISTPLSGTEDGWFSGGYIEYFTDGILQRRGIRTHSGDELQLFGGPSGLSVGMTFTAYPGCDLTINTCERKFSNTLNYGGCPHMPGVSPWEIIKVF